MGIIQDQKQPFVFLPEHAKPFDHLFNKVGLFSACIETSLAQNGAQHLGVRAIGLLHQPFLGGWLVKAFVDNDSDCLVIKAACHHFRNCGFSGFTRPGEHLDHPRFTEAGGDFPKHCPLIASEILDFKIWCVRWSGTGRCWRGRTNAWLVHPFSPPK
ncbi:MAG: hypothetical protein DIKNOCCD_01120 [bacterium]|nr:hypothetical protein [bacterium]